MSIIVHRCTACGHTDLPRRDTRGGPVLKACPEHCPCRTCTPGEPEVMTTYRVPDGAPVADITAPGKPWLGITTCGCEACKALHTRLKGRVSA